MCEDILPYWSNSKKNAFFFKEWWGGNLVDPTEKHSRPKKSTQGSSVAYLKYFLKYAKKNKVKSRRKSWSFNFWRL